MVQHRVVGRKKRERVVHVCCLVCERGEEGELSLKSAPGSELRRERGPATGHAVGHEGLRARCAVDLELQLYLSFIRLFGFRCWPYSTAP